MRALHLGPAAHLIDVPEPLAAEGEALVALRVAGVCDTDLQLARGYMGFTGIPGHEFVGEVLECSDAAWIGKRVVGDINAGCGVCTDCTERDGHHCLQRSVLGILGRPGCLAERFTLPARNLVAVPDDVPDEVAVFAEPFAAGLHVLQEVERAGARRVAVLGDGKLGLLTAFALRGAGVEVCVIGHHEAKLSLARGAGAQAVLEAELASDSEPFDLVVEATGSPAGLQRGLQLLNSRGTLVLKTTVAAAREIDLTPLVVNELRLVGSRCGDLGQAIEHFARGNADPRALIDVRYPLERATEALDHAGRRGVLKVLVTP